MKIVFAGLILLAVLPAKPLSARTLSFPPQNFKCEVADTWKIISATGAWVDASDGSGNDLSISTRLQDAALTLDSPAFLESTTLFAQSKDFQVDHRRDIRLQGEQFQEWRLSATSASSRHPTLARFILADGYLYMIAISSPDDPGQHSDLMAMADSFRFINPPHIPVATGFGGFNSDVIDHMSSVLIFVGSLCTFAFLPIVGITGAIWALKREEKPRFIPKGKS
jgi:hypothetical protein